MKENSLYHYIDHLHKEGKLETCLPKYIFKIRHDYILIGENPHIRVDRLYNSDNEIYTKSHYTEEIGNGVIARVYFTNYGKIRNITVKQNNIKSEICQEKSLKLKEGAAADYSRTIIALSQELDDFETAVKNKITTLGADDFAQQVEMLIKFRPESWRLYNTWKNINASLNGISESKAPMVTELSKLEENTAEVKVYAEEVKNEIEQAKDNTSEKIINSLYSAVQKNLEQKEWAELVVNVDLLLLQGSDVSEFYEKINAEFAKFDLEVIRQMFKITEPNINEQHFVNLFLDLIVVEDKKIEDNLLSIVEFLNNNSKSFSLFITVFDEKMKDHINYFKQIIAKKYIKDMKDAVSVEHKKQSGKVGSLLGTFLEALEQEDSLILDNHKAAIDYMFEKSQYVFYEIKIIEFLNFTYLIFAAFQSKYNVFKALLDCFYDATNGLTSCILALHQFSDKELSKYLRLLIRQGHDPNFLLSEHKQIINKIRLQTAAFKARNKCTLQIGVDGTILDFLEDKPASLKEIIGKYDKLEHLIVSFTRISASSEIVRRIEIEKSYHEIVFDVVGSNNLKQVFSGFAMHLRILFAPIGPSESKILCLDLILGRIYQLLPRCDQPECHFLMDALDKSKISDNKYLTLLSRCYLNLFLYSLGKIDKKAYIDKFFDIPNYIENLDDPRKIEDLSLFYDKVKEAKRIERDIIVSHMHGITCYNMLASFKSAIVPETYFLVCFDDNLISAVSFSNNNNKKQILSKVHNPEGKIYIFHSNFIEDSFTYNWLKENFGLAKFVECGRLGEIKVAVNRNITHSFINKACEILVDQYFIMSYELLVDKYYYEHISSPGSGAPFISYDCENYLFDLVENNDLTSVKQFFCNAYLMPCEAFMRCYEKLKRIAVIKKLGKCAKERYSEQDLDKNIEIFKILLFHAGNEFCRFCCTKENATSVYKKLSKYLADQQVANKEYKNAFLQGINRKLGLVQEKLCSQIRNSSYSIINILFYGSERKELASLFDNCNFPSGLQQNEVENIQDVTDKKKFCFNTLLEVSNIKAVNYTIASYVRGQPENAQLKDPELFPSSDYLQNLDLLSNGLASISREDKRHIPGP